ncbi:hypothetical protein QQ008_07750 [Fulvivirgaceae bacterium BMA10]|uniref:Uncharacterized protein n=1 Tax=Splendidivirga corallicola TaxID=3051826 RepID=A0ABT8KKK4_9BACT|nr:hypothetical protein [Fulvivirgaceae bacterium BMA10]
MDYIKLSVAFFGATGFWKLIESAIKWRLDKKLKSAEASNIFAQANKEVIESFLKLSQELKDQLGRQKERIDELEKLVEKEKKRNDDLEKLVSRLEERNHELETELNKLKHAKSIKQ